jgi:hypothetical protein
VANPELCDRLDSELRRQLGLVSAADSETGATGDQPSLLKTAKTA